MQNRVCVPQDGLESCERMAAENELHINCVPARDRVECLDKVQHRLADFVPVDPEDMYLASKIPHQDFMIFKEIRTKEEPDERKYTNLCALCEHPDVCDYPDKYSGYDGALRCLSEHGGQVAWTKVYFVKKHFGLAIGAGEAVPTGEDPNNYAFLCPDATKKPITGKPCIWAARPWQGYMANHDMDSNVADLRAEISRANEIGENEHADWLSKVLDLNNKTIPVDNQGPYSPEYYLNKDTELQKCRLLKNAAFSRDIRPAFDCVQEAGLHECLRTIRDDGADVMTLDGGEVFIAQRQYNLKPIVAEQYGEHGSLYYAVAVVKKSSSYQSIEDLRGWNVPLYTLLNKGLISRNSCPYSSALSTFFTGGSCVPGALVPENNPNNQNPETLCSICAGNLDAPTNDPAWKCSFSNNESYFGYTGAFRCLAAGGDGHNTAAWASGLKSEDYELLCPDGGRAPVTEYLRCHLAQVPPHMNSATGLLSVENGSPLMQRYSEILEVIKACENQPTP
ncbi:Transferrin [Blattella germanica]|nr:Transferrin [Blattella germanica]